MVILAIELSVLWFTVSDYLCGIFFFWPLSCLSFDLRFLNTSVVSSLSCRSFDLRFLITSVVSSLSCRSFFSWPLSFLSFDLRFLITSVVSSFSCRSFFSWPLSCLCFDLRFLITSVVSFSLYHWGVWSLFYTDNSMVKIKGPTTQWSRYHRANQKP
jgi:hypothetical protein